VGAAQLNGLNLLSNTEKTAGTGTVNVLSSLDRSSTGVSAANIGVGKEDLGTRASSISLTATAVAVADDRMTGTIAGAVTAVAGAATPATQALTIDSAVVGQGYSLAITASAGQVDTTLNTTDRNTISYVARDGDTAADVAKGLADAFNRHVAKTLEGTGISDTEKAAMASIRATVSGGTVTVSGATGAAADTLSLQASGYAAADTTIGGGLAQVAKIDVTTAAGAKSALTEIEGLLTTATAAAASFGSAQGRIETQAKFISGLTDSLKAGIGTLVDADMEEASARLQALQVQQQLGVQALSIANQAPQSIMSLFR
jgi:flagellin